MSSLLKTLYDRSLLRTQRIQHDLSLLPPLLSSHDNTQPQRVLTTQLITSRIQSRPHVLIAYTWIMYHALFNGGRWIRAQLLSASVPHFWPAASDRENCLTLWRFDGDRDGEDIKEAFKVRFDCVSAQLSEEEQQDVVDEAVDLFKLCADLVEHLDHAVGAASQADENDQPQQQQRHYLRLGSSSASPNLHLVSSLTHQLSAIIAWMWALVLGPASATTAQKHSLAARSVPISEDARVR